MYYIFKPKHIALPHKKSKLNTSITYEKSELGNEIPYEWNNYPNGFITRYTRYELENQYCQRLRTNKALVLVFTRESTNIKTLTRAPIFYLSFK